MWPSPFRRRTARPAAAADASGRRRSIWTSRPLLLSSACLLLLSLAILGRIGLSFLSLPRSLELEQRCRMSRMWPSYVVHTHPSPSGLDKKYRLLLYRERPPDPHRSPEDDLPKGRPALFVPGNAGSYGQVRSVASSSHHQHRARQHEEELDWWTVDFNEDFSAFHGGTMDEQATYLNEVIQYLVNQVYTSSSSPVKVAVLGHSMGGLVARLMLDKDNHPKGSVDTIVTLSSPHAYPPVPLDVGVEGVYTRVNRKAWDMANNADKNGEESLLLISLSGGVLDNQLASEPSSLRLARLTSDDASLSAFTASLAGFWSGVDHLAMMWCDQLRYRIARGFIRDVGRGASLRERREHWRISLGIENIDEVHATLMKPEGRLGGKGQVKSFRVGTSPQAFQVLTSLDVGPDDVFGPDSGETAVEVRLCSASSVCQVLSSSAFLVFPPSPAKEQPFPQAEARYELPGVGFRKLYLSSPQLKQTDTVRIEVVRKDNHEGLLDARFVSEIPSLQPVGIMPLVWGLVASFEPDMDSVTIPAMDSSLLAYDLDFLRTASAGSCSGKEGLEGVAPLVRARDLSTGDVQYYPSINLAAQKRKTLTLHSTSPYMPPGRLRGTVFQRFLDPCNELAGIRVRINWSVSAGLLVSRYRTALVAFPFAIVASLCALIWHEWDQSGSFAKPSTALSWHASDLMSFSGFISVTAVVVQKTLLNLFPASTSASSQAVQDVFVGLGSSPLILSLIVGPLLFVAAYGLALWVSLAFEGLVWVAASLSRACKLDAPLSLPLQLSHGEAKTEGAKVQLKKSTLVGFALVIVVLWTAVPIQFAVLAAFVVHLVVTIRSALPLRRCSAMEEAARADQHAQHLLLLNLLFWVVPLHAPVLFVWAQNLVNGWIAPLASSSDHDASRILSILVVVQVASSGRVLERARSSAEATITRLAFLFVGGATLVYGIRHTYRISILINGVLSWILFVHFRARWFPASIAHPPGSSSLPEATRAGKGEEEDDILLEDRLGPGGRRGAKERGSANYSNLPNEVASAFEEMPASLRQSLVGQSDNEAGKEPYRVGEDAAEDEKAEPSDMQEAKLDDLDEALARYLELMDEYVVLRGQHVDERLGAGHLHLGKAKMQLGRFRLGEDGWDARMKARKGTSWDEEQGSWKIVERKIEEDELEGEVTGEMEDELPGKGDGLRRRKGTEQVAAEPSKEDKDDDKKKKDDAATATKEKAREIQPYDALYQFAALPPPSLRRAQTEFGRALQGLGGASLEGNRTVLQVLGEMRMVEKEIIELKRSTQDASVE